MKLLLVFFISLFAIVSASKIEFDILKFFIQTLGQHPKNRHPSIVLRREKRQIDSVATSEKVNPIAGMSVTPAAEILFALMTESTTTSQKIATSAKMPSTLSFSIGDPTSPVWAVNPSTQATTLAAETSILTDQQTVITLKNSINEATKVGEIISLAEPTIADGETLTSISNIKSSTPSSFPANPFDETFEDQITRIKDNLEHSTEKQIEKLKETWAIFKFYLMESLVPESKLNAAHYVHFSLSNAEEIKRNVKLFTDFTERIQRNPGYQLQEVMDSWEKLQKILESYSGVSPSKSQPDSSSKASTTEIPNQTTGQTIRAKLRTKLVFIGQY